MRIFVTGASGWIGSAVVPELLDAGHEVLGLARSDASARAVEALGAAVQRGGLDNLESLRAGAAAADGVVHLAYIHDFSDMAGAAAADRQAIEVLGSALEGTGGPLVIASGTLGLASGRPAVETDVPDENQHPRIANANLALSFADRGVRPIAVRFAPTVHGPGDHGFVATLVGIARERGVSAYVDDGANEWSAVHRLDAAHLVRLAVDGAPPASVVHAVGENVATRTIAEAIGRGLQVPVRSVPAEQAVDHFGWIGRFFGADASATHELTSELLGWQPAHATLLADLDDGAYFGGEARRSPVTG